VPVIPKTVFGYRESSETDRKAPTFVREIHYNRYLALDSRQPKTVSGMNCLAKHCFFDFQRLASTVPTP
jgi:hypothetical protein